MESHLVIATDINEFIYFIVAKIKRQRFVKIARCRFRGKSSDAKISFPLLDGKNRLRRLYKECHFLAISPAFYHTHTHTSPIIMTLSKKSVRFSDIQMVRYTHSPSEYDRSCFALTNTYTLYKPRTTPLSIRKRGIPSKPAASRPVVKPLDLNILPNATNRKPRQSLRIDTQSVGNGPLFLTGLSTQYRCRTEDDEDDTFLVSMTLSI